jgi:DNA-binding CsgD family transcriptional regulator
MHLANARPIANAGPTVTDADVLDGRPVDRFASAIAEKAAAMTAALDGFAAAIFLVDPGARIIYSNTKARTLLAKANVVRESMGRLSALDPAADRHLRGLLTRMLTGAHGAPNAGVAVPLATAGSRHAWSEYAWIAHVLPLIADRLRKSRHLAALASVIVREAKADLMPALATVAATYGLTAGQSRMLAAIVNAGGVRQAAQTLGVSETTAKTHLKRIFEKTGTSRQIELIKLVAGFTCPVA